MIKISSSASNQTGSCISWSNVKNKWIKYTRKREIIKGNKIIFFYNFNLPACNTCPNAPISCKEV